MDRCEGRTAGTAALGLLIGVAIAAASGCGGTARPPRGSAATADAVTTVDYTLKGVVLSVAPESGRVLIRHQEVPGFMKAMTMPFEPADKSILGLLHPGDHVEGVLHVERKDGAVRDYQLRDLKVTEPAAPEAMVLDVSKGNVKIRQQPVRLHVGEEVPDFEMTGQDGKPVRLSDDRGKVVVLTFIYTRCRCRTSAR